MALALRERGAMRSGSILALAGLLFGAAAGLGLFTFVHAEGTSYLTNDPEACGNCHVMQPQLTGWSRSSHHGVAVCNDCHAPAGLVNKYYTKALNGWNHGRAFTTGDFAEPIRVTERNRAIAAEACLGCHQDLVRDVAGHGDEAISCIRCHGSVGHR